MRLVAALTAFLLVAMRAALAATPHVSIVVADSGPAYQEAAQAAAQELAARAGVNVTQADEFERAPRQDVALVIALGTRALHAALASGTGAPIVATLIPRSAYESAVRNGQRSPGGRAVTAVYLDQPVVRQLNLVRIVVPGKTRVGVLASPASEEIVRRVESAARERGLSVVGESVANSRDLSAALSRVLGGSELLLALPDASIFNAGTIHNILLSALRAQQPLFGFSEAYVRAGAVAAVYSMPRQVGRQAGEIAARALAGAPLPPPQFPRAFSVSVNYTVARALGIALEEEPAIAARLQRMEREP